MKKMLLSLVVPPLLFCLAAFLGWTSMPLVRARAPEQQHGVDSVQGPEHWVPFAARIELLLAGGQKLTGTVARAANGSRRTELYSRDGQLNSINIVSVPDAVTYYYDSKGGWRAVRGGSIRTEPIPRATAGFLGTKSPTAWEGVQVYERVADGLVTMVSPELNFEAVYALTVRTGLGHVLRDIRIGDQDAGLFVLPEGVSAKPVTAVPAGQQAQPKN